MFPINTASEKNIGIIPVCQLVYMNWQAYDERLEKAVQGGGEACTPESET